MRTIATAFFVALVVAAVGTACGSARRVTTVSTAPYPEGPRPPIAAVHPKAGEVPLSRIADAIPRTFPKNPPQHCNRGAIVRITFSDGKTLTYGPCERPASIERLRLALDRMIHY